MARRVLLVDDSPFIREQLRAVLERQLHAEVFEAPDGSQALAQCEHILPDVVVVDFAMPGMNGCRTGAEILRAQGTMPIALFTLYPEPCLNQLAAENGIEAVFSKADWVPLLSWIERKLECYPGHKSQDQQSRTA